MGGALRPSLLSPQPNTAMSTRIKDLNEKRGAKLKEANALITAASAEKRELTADEQQKIAAIHTDAEAIVNTITIEARQLALESSNAPKLTKSEERTVDSFDISRLLRHMAANFDGSPSQLDGAEAELVQEGQREARAAGVRFSGLMLPRALVRRSGAGIETRDMSVTGGTTTQYGGNLVATEKRGLADDFYNGSVLRANGALVLEGLVGNVDLPRYTKASDPTKKAENANADELSPTITSLSLTPRRLPAFVDLSDQLLLQNSVALESFLRRAIAEQMLGVQEVAFFHGGGTNEPTGIAATSGIGSVAGGTNGLAPALSHIIGLETAVDVLNAAVGNLRYLTNSKVRGKLKQTAKIASTDSMTLLDDRAGGLLNGYQPVITNAISSTLTKGSSSGVCSAVFFGNVNDFVIGYWGGISLEMVRDKSGAIAGQRTLVANAYYDGGVLRPKSFAAMLDALTT